MKSIAKGMRRSKKFARLRAECQVATVIQNFGNGEMIELIQKLNDESRRKYNGYKRRRRR